MASPPKSPPDLRIVDARTGRISIPWLRWFEQTANIVRTAVTGVISGTAGNVVKIATGGALEDTGFAASSVGIKGAIDHGSHLIGLGDDDHTQYALLGGRSGGQSLRGSTAANENLTLESTAHATKGDVLCKDRFRLDTNGYAWIDVNLGSTSLGTGASAPGIVVLTGGIYTLGFDGIATMEQVFGTVELPHEWVEGTDIYPHIHWIPATAAAGNVKWQLEYTWTALNDAELASTTISVTQATPGAVSNVRADFPAISGVGKMINSQFTFRLFRDPTDAADTYGADALTKTFGLHLQVNTHGSRTQGAK